jgi:hypothetical protein
MTRTLSESNALEEIDRLCVRLFDNWCERRSVIPLSFLMHAWPILRAAPLARTRLLNTLQELQQFHPDSLSAEDHQVIEWVLAIQSREGKTNPGDSLP